MAPSQSKPKHAPTFMLDCPLCLECWVSTVRDPGACPICGRPRLLRRGSDSLPFQPEAYAPGALSESDFEACQEFQMDHIDTLHSEAWVAVVKGFAGPPEPISSRR